ncbi:hypothetical protein [Salinivibrio sp. IB643]|uniref:hypothetical protein n=1 Tax=Salinivibrio sp. IB643 TaxID=1909445 RepID=UPI00098956B5|nr:hypothetical protein [Salinivibrio sp. IB643]OOE96157.1 hypothetical protein BZG77_12600 [Salinivibrio sp. IB643]
MKVTLWLVGILLMSGLWGCTPAYQTEGTQVLLAPVTYQLTLSTSASQSDFEQFTRFASHHQKLVLTQPITIDYNTPRGEQAAKKAQRYLLKLGVESQNIRRRSAALEDGDWRVSVVTYQVKPQACHPVKIADVRQNKTGCVVTQNRWLSKVHPERGLSHEEGEY